MRKEILEHLYRITEEEEQLLTGRNTITKDLYTSEDDFVVDSSKLLEQGKLIAIRPHTRFSHFP